ARDPELPGGVHDRKRLRLGFAGAEELGRRADPAEVSGSEHDPGDLDTGAAEWCVPHRSILAGGVVQDVDKCLPVRHPRLTQLPPRTDRATSSTFACVPT